MSNMKYDQHLVTLPWKDYELLDSGENMKLERFGEVVLARPETQALWKKRQPKLWEEAHATFLFKEKKGEWDLRKAIPESWEASNEAMRFRLRLTGFKHTGIFPEQEPNWAWIAEQVAKLDAPNVLNLFGYTGIASIAAAQAGAFVTHVDASKQALDWAHDNARLSGVGEDKIRWILDDALAFVKREVRRGAQYQAIILDPPAFGRGAKGEVWKIEEDFSPLLDSLKAIFPDAPGSLLLVNGYAAGYAAGSFAQAVESTFGDTINGQCGELHIKESTGDRVIPCGIYVRFVR
jgi:23S rRNA (cytosine1962-C5)-methyltransferase